MKVESADQGFAKFFLTYGAAILAVIAATLLRVALATLVGPAIPFLTYFVVAILLAWYRGFWPAAFSVPISVILGTHYILRSDAPGLLTSGRSERATIFGFVLVSLTLSFLIDFQRKTLKRARAAERAQSIIAGENEGLLKQAELAARQLKQSNDELKRANRDLEMFAYSAGHDLQEPLRTISISAQLIDRSVPQTEGVRDHLRKILTAVRRMDSFLQDIRSYISTANVNMEPPPKANSKHILLEVLERLQGSIAESGAVITAGELPVIAMDENQLSQVLQNLISNAIKYRSPEPPRVHIEASARVNFWVFSVIDNGIGIDPTFSEKIFELFKRLHGQEQYQGNGIGLAICQRIVEKYGGRIWVAQSELGKGSTFCFSVPCIGEEKLNGQEGVKAPDQDLHATQKE